MKHPEMNLTYFISQQDSQAYSKTLSRAVGVLRAIVLGQIIWWTAVSAQHAKNDTEDRHFRDGRWWIFNQDKDLEQLFYGLKLRTVRDILRDLESQNLIISRTDMNRMKLDRTKWYTPNEGAIDAYIKLWDSMGRPVRGENGARSKDIKAFVKAWEEVKDNYNVEVIHCHASDMKDDESDDDNDTNVRQTDNAQCTSNVYTEDTSNVYTEDTSNVGTITSSTSSTNNTSITEIVHASDCAESESPADADSEGKSDSHNGYDALGKLPLPKSNDNYSQVGAMRNYEEIEYAEPILMIQAIREVFPKMKFYKRNKEALTKNEVFAPDGTKQKVSYPHSLEALMHKNDMFRVFVKTRCNQLKEVYKSTGKGKITASYVISNLLKVHHINEKNPAWHGWRQWFIDQNGGVVEEVNSDPEPLVVEKYESYYQAPTGDFMDDVDISKPLTQEDYDEFFEMIGYSREEEGES